MTKPARPQPFGAPRQRRASFARLTALVATAVAALLATGGLQLFHVDRAKHLVALGPHAELPIAAAATSVATQGSVVSGRSGKPRSSVRPTPGPPSPTTTTTTLPPVPRVTSFSPANGAHDIGFKAPITIRLSQPPQARGPLPVLYPQVQGVWSVHGRTLRFVPSVGYEPWATEVVRVPEGLAAPLKFKFDVVGVGVPRAEELFAELKYIPLRFGPTPASSSLDAESAVADLVSPLQQPGIFTWRYPDIPATLSDLWSATRYNVILQGAIMHFEQRENLPVDGLMGPLVWKALSTAIADRAVDAAPYDFLMVSETVPEALVVWRDGKDIYQTPANTGVYGAVTPVGTWPVYLRFVSTTMVGTDPDGYHYDVTDVPWVAYFNGGDAVHGYWRYSYGYPQSNGCVELPVSNAQTVWSMDPIGTLVNVNS